jgi:hypothetical protein
MLARTYKTAKELRISKKRYAALLDVLDLLDNGALRHVPIDTDFAICGFNMENYVGDRCDTVHCIAGWCDWLHDTKFAEYMDKPHPFELELLFYVDDDCEDRTKITVAQAAAALRNYLTLGEPLWYLVLGLE